MPPIPTSLWCSRLLAAGLSFIFIIGGSPQAYACACCADRGERHEGAVPLADYTQDVLRGLKFASRANLYITDAGWEIIRNFRNPAKSEIYRVKVTLQGTDWTFRFADGKGNKGTLKFSSGDNIRQFAVDPKPQASEGPGYVSVKLYKEWTIKNRLSQSGMFKTPDRGANTVKLILHGRGNGCPDAAQFTNWTLDVWHKTSQADKPVLQYRFFGRLISGQ